MQQHYTSLFKLITVQGLSHYQLSLHFFTALLHVYLFFLIVFTRTRLHENR